MTTTTRPAPVGADLSAERPARRHRTYPFVVLILLVLAVVAVITWIGLQAARGPSGRSVSTTGGATTVLWGGPATDGGYRCLRDTGGASGQCNAEMGIGPWQIPASDGGYQCLRDTGGASGQCTAAEGLPNSRRAVAGSNVGTAR